jgi:hypothetical protein
MGAMRYIIWFDRLGKGGGSDPLGTRATIRATSRSHRTQISRVQGTGEVANRFRPQSLLARRAPPARPYLTPYPSAWVRDITYGDTVRGKGSGPHAQWKATRLSNGFGFTDSIQTPPRSPDARFPGLGLGGRPVTQALPAAARDASLRQPPSPAAPTLHRVNAQTRKRARWLRQAIHFVLAPAASQDQWVA